MQEFDKEIQDKQRKQNLITDNLLRLKFDEDDQDV